MTSCLYILVLLLLQRSTAVFIDFPYVNDLHYTIGWSVKGQNITWFLSMNQTLPKLEGNRTNDVVGLFKEHMPKRWFSFALSNNVNGKPFMSNADYLMVSMNAVDNEMRCDISDRWAQVAGLPPLDSEFGGQEDLHLLKSELTLFNDNKTLAASCLFTRRLITNDPFDVAIRDRVLVLGWAHGEISKSGVFQKHVRTVTVRFANLVSGEQPFNYLPPPRFKERYFWHGVLMTTAFFVLMIPGTFLARYFKAAVPSWFFIHWKMQAAAVVIALIATVVAAVELDWHVPMDIHVIIGLTVVAFLILQSFVGYMSNALWFEGKPPHWWPDKLHWWLGRLILAVGTLNLFLGIMSYREKDLSHLGIGWGWSIAAYFVYLKLVVVSILVLEMRVGQQHEHIGFEPLENEVATDDNATSKVWSLKRVRHFGVGMFSSFVAVVITFLMLLHFA